jgi:hypothetical protein
MEQQRLGAAKEAVQAGQQQMLSGFGTMAGAGATFMSGFAETAEIPTDEV